MAPIRITETDLFITGDGQQYQLSSPPNRIIVSEEGTGMPPISYVTQRGPYQHGETLRDYFLTPRVVQLIVRHQYCSRAEYWAGRAALLGVLRPNRPSVMPPSQGVLRKIMPGGITRDLSCIIQQGPAFSPRQSGQWDEWAYTETLKFVAHNPIYFDPVQKVTVFSIGGPATFPMTFPVTFIGGRASLVVPYSGDWQEYPTITLFGPLNNITITNTTTGDVLSLVYPLPAARSITIALTYGNKSVTLDDGTNLIGTIGVDSNLAQWHFASGNNNISIDIGGSGAATSITFSYYNRYVGI